MESLIALIFLPNMLVAIWLIVTLTSGISQLNTAQSEHLNGWRYILIELLTTLFSPFLGFALLSEKNSDEYSSFTYNLFPQEMIPTIMALYAICIIGYWVIKLNRALLAQTSYLLIFSLLVWVLTFITCIAALSLLTKRFDWSVMFFPIIGFPIMAIFINLFVYTYRLIWCNTLHKFYQSQN